MTRFLRAAFAAAILLSSPVLAQDGTTQLGSIAISQPFARATLPNAPVGGGSFTIENAGSQADRLISAASPAAETVQIHEMALEGEVMRMRQLEQGVELPPGETITFAPGGLHIMFMGLKEAFVEGEDVPLTLTFEQAGSVEITLPVLGVAADAPPVSPGHEGH